MAIVLVRAILPASLVMPLGLPASTDREVDPDLDLDTYFDLPYEAQREAYEDLMMRRIRGQINRYLVDYTEQVVVEREQHWHRDLSSVSAYRKSVSPQRQKLRKRLGVVDERRPASITYFSKDGPSARVAETAHYTIDQVRWTVLDGIDAEGLLLTPRGDVQARVVAIPDADQTPEQLTGLTDGIAPEAQFARRLAAGGAQVLAPALINRGSDFSAFETIPFNAWRPSERLHRKLSLRSNRTHRETLWRQAFVMGRHPIGYELQKVFAGLDWFQQQDKHAPLAVAGYGEGGLLAFYAAALDERLEAALVSGYFQNRDEVYREPVERLVWGFLKNFGDAEIAGLITPRKLIVEYSEVPQVQLPKELPVSDDLHWRKRGTRRSGQKGRLSTPPFDAVADEVQRAEALFEGGSVEPRITFLHGPDDTTVGPGSDEALNALLAALGAGSFTKDAQPPSAKGELANPNDRQQRMLAQISEHLEKQLAHTGYDRYRFLNADIDSPAAWDESMEEYRQILYDQVIGRLPDSHAPGDPNPRLRKAFDEEGWTGYEVIWDALPGVHGWGLLAIPDDLEEGEQRPTVVTQHGAHGTPTTPWKTDSYHNLMPRLVKRGFVVFAPHNPFWFDVRRAFPVGATPHSFIIPHYRQMLRWLKERGEVDADRIGYYGKSWGGRTGLVAGPFIPEFRFVICSAFFNDWPRKAATRQYATSAFYTGSIGTLKWNMGRTFGHAELAQLIAPRPFMVENGYYDAATPDEWAASEFVKVERLYHLLGIGDRAVWGNHVAGHVVHGDTIFPFIHKHLQHPVPAME